MSEEWDNLIILDGCRYDTFHARNPYSQTAERRYSNASHTKEFLRRNFESEYLDTVYVTANPWVREYETKFAHVEHVWQTHWDETHRTVRPSSVVDATLDIRERYPDKRYIIHFMQPHYPFIGPTGRKIGQQASFRRWWRRYSASVWEQAWAGRVDVDLLKAAYAENLELALPEVQRLTEQIDGKTVVSSDHGTLFGKRVCCLPIDIYGHPPGIHDPELTAVPWLELPFENRRSVTKMVEESDSVDEQTKSVPWRERLRDLGYRLYSGVRVSGEIGVGQQSSVNLS
jgi:hypothetical protein